MIVQNNNLWDRQRHLETQLSTLQLAAEVIAGVIFDTESDPKYRYLSHHDGLRHALDELDVLATNLKKDE